MPGPDEARHPGSTAFGPASDSINIPKFLHAVEAKSRLVERVHTAWLDIAEAERQRVEKELGLNELKVKTDRLIRKEPLRRLFLQRYEDNAVKRKEYGLSLPVPAGDPEYDQLVRALDQSPLKHWPPTKQSVYYFHKNKRTHENALTSIRPTEIGAAPGDPNAEAIITISYHSRATKPSNRNESWSNNFVLDAVYDFLGSQTLKDVYDTVACTNKDLPREIWKESKLVGYMNSPAHADVGGLIIGSTAYRNDDGRWGRKLVQMGGASRITEVGKPLHKVKLSDIPLRIQALYWILHQGSCYHCWTVEGIRLLAVSDPQKDYPIALHIARQHSPTCHHCGRNPVTLAVNGDTRLGESPSRICEACWNIMGIPKEGSGVVVVPFRG